MYEKIIGGLGVMGGGILEGIGQRQGLQSIEGELGRQKQEWAAGNAEQQGMIEQELAKRRAALNADVIAPGMAAQSAAMGGMTTMGRGLGLGGANVAQVRSGLMPLMPIQARKVGKAKQAADEDTRMADLNTDLDQSRSAQELMGSTYPDRLKIAAQTGSTQRRLGVFAQQAGKGIFSMGSTPGKSLPI